ncbi:hypothetical protein BGZ63DRAFT_428057 [Mariannaea sp. PMI_226]|nr:hypothetical protein BGZ63DRAFT_428057 [Mariannaea sp. PMI_226]
MAATATIDQSLRLIHRVTAAIDNHKNGNKRLEFLCQDLSSTTEVIKLVQALEDLWTKGVLKSLNNMLKHAQELELHVLSVKKKSSTGHSFRQMAYQFMSGPGELERTNKMVAELMTLKATLILQIQVAHVGLTVGKDQEKQNHFVNSVILHKVNEAVEMKLGKGKGLKIAEVLQGKKPDGNGMIYLTKEEYECLLLHESDEDDASKELGTIRVANNLTTDQALQINGFIDDGWQNISPNFDLTIEHNKSHNESIQVNGPIQAGNLAQVLNARNETIQVTREGQWPQSPPMPQQSMSRELPQAWLIPSWPYGQPGAIHHVNAPGHGPPGIYYGQHGAIEHANALGNGTHGTVGAPRQVTMSENQLSVDSPRDGMDDTDSAMGDDIH